MDGASIFELQQYLENLRTFKKKLPASVEEPRPSSNDLNEVSGDSSTALQQTAETKFDQSSVNDEESSVENLLKNLKFVVFDARSPSPDRNNIKRRLQKRLPVNESIDLVCVVADLFKSFEKKANGEELTRPEVNLDLLESGEADMELEHLFNEHSRKNSEILNMSNEDGVGNDSRFVLNNDQRMDVDTSDSSSEERAGKNVQNVPDGRYSAKPFKVAQELPENEVFEAVSLGSSVKNFSSTSEAKNDNNTPIIKAVAEIFTSMFILTKNNSAKILNDIVQQVTENGDVNIFKTAPPIPHSLINNFNSALAAWKVTI